MEENTKIEIEQQEYDDLKKELDSWKNKTLYLAADFDNYKKRQIENTLKLTEYKNQEALSKLLEIVDDFNLADKGNYMDEPTRMIFSKFMNCLKDLGLSEIEFNESPIMFTDETMNAVMSVNIPDKENNEVVEVIKKGYMYKDTVLRYAQVIVNVKND